MDFSATLETQKPAKDELALVWLGQAGFLIKTHGGRVIVIDPYLTDYADRLLRDEHGQGFKRMTPAVFASHEIKIDTLLISHEHPDHLDIDAMPGFLSNPGLVCYANAESIREAAKNGLDTGRFRPVHKEQRISLPECELIITDSDHGELAPGALGFVLDFGFAVLYYSGDTCCNKKRLSGVMDMRVDVALLPINGAFGNLDAESASVFANDLRAGLCVPHHFWTFPLHDGNAGSPKDAVEYFPRNAPDCKLYLATPGRAVTIGAGGAVIEKK